MIKPNGQYLPFNRWKPHNNEKAEGLKKTYDPAHLRLKAKAKETEAKLNA